MCHFFQCGNCQESIVLTSVGRERLEQSVQYTNQKEEVGGDVYINQISPEFRARLSE